MSLTINHMALQTVLHDEKKIKRFVHPWILNHRTVINVIIITVIISATQVQCIPEDYVYVFSSSYIYILFLLSKIEAMVT